MPPPARGRERISKRSSGPLQRAASKVKAGVTGISVNHYNSNQYDNIYYRIYGMR